SSRRRHTRCLSDWSSDVCSSDLFFERQMRTASFVVFEIILQNPAQPGLMENNDVIQAFATDGAHQSFRKGILPRRSRRSQDFPRSEERRVGKECRCQWAAEQ